MRPENFFARVSDFYRTLSFAGSHSGDDLKRDDFALAAEAAADQRLDHANLRHRHVEHERKFVLQVIRHLR